MTLLLHCRDVTADAAEGLHSGYGLKTTTDLLLDFHHPQISLGQNVVKGYGKVCHKGQRFCLILHQPIQQILVFAVFLAPPLARWQRRVVVLFFQTGLQQSPVALCVVRDLSSGAWASV